MNSTKDTQAILILAPPDTTNDIIKPPPFPPSPQSFFSCFNFIFDRNGTLYFYQHFYDKDKTPVAVSDIEIPSRINLTPDQIIVLSDTEIRSFFESNIVPVDPAYKSVSIIGTTDTIKCKELTSLMKEVTDTVNHISYFVRPVTLEEATVLEYKKMQKFYNPDKINWDSAKVWFDQKQRK